MSRPGKLRLQAMNANQVYLGRHTIAELECTLENLLSEVETALLEIETAEEHMCVDDREIVSLVANGNDTLKERFSFGKLCTSQQAQGGCIHLDELNGVIPDRPGHEPALQQRGFRSFQFTGLGIQIAKHPEKTRSVLRILLRKTGKALLASFDSLDVLVQKEVFQGPNQPHTTDRDIIASSPPVNRGRGHEDSAPSRLSHAQQRPSVFPAEL